MPETITRSGAGRLAVQVRTARKGHPCNDCSEPILPGEKYELAVYPPHSVQEYDVDRWVIWRTHYPRHTSHTFLIGCDMAAAYREQNRRLRARALARASMRIGHDLDLLECATRSVVAAQYANPALIQRKVRLGFAKAGRLFLLLADYGVIGLTENRGRYPVLVPPADLNSALYDLRQFSEKEKASA